MATEVRHTPGPWWIFDTYNVMAGSGHDRRSVASCGGVSSSRDDGTREENIANAMLVSAAPDLLKVLNAVMMAPASHLRPGSEIWKACLAAIAKATGEPPITFKAHATGQEVPVQ